MNLSFKGSFSLIVTLSPLFSVRLGFTHPEELGAWLVDGYYDDTVPPGQLCQQHHNLIGGHAVQASGRLVQ